jgi:hypothetical protein
MVYIQKADKHMLGHTNVITEEDFNSIPTTGYQKILRHGPTRLKPKNDVRVQGVIEPEEGQPGFLSFSDGMKAENGGDEMTMAAVAEMSGGWGCFWVLCTHKASNAERGQAMKEGRELRPKWVKCLVNPTQLGHLKQPLGRQVTLLNTPLEVPDDEEE